MTQKEKYEELYKFLFEKSTAANVEPVFETEDGEEIALDDKATFVLNQILEEAFIPYLAEALTIAGYHRHEEAHWIVAGAFDDFLKCSNCGESWPWATAAEFLFCPHCGKLMIKPED